MFRRRTGFLIQGRDEILLLFAGLVAESRLFLLLSVFQFLVSFGGQLEFADEGFHVVEAPIEEDHIVMNALRFRKLLTTQRGGAPDVVTIVVIVSIIAAAKWDADGLSDEGGLGCRWTDGRR